MSETERRIEAALQHLDGTRGALETLHTLRRGLTKGLIKYHVLKLRRAADELEKLL